MAERNPEEGIQNAFGASVAVRMANSESRHLGGRIQEGWCHRAEEVREISFGFELVVE